MTGLDDAIQPDQALPTSADPRLTLGVVTGFVAILSFVLLIGSG